MKIQQIAIVSFMIIALGWLFPANALATNGGTEEVTIQTNAICGMCKNRIETALMQMKGVKFAELNLETKAVLVKYKANKVAVADIKNTIVGLGYDADDKQADTTARKALPMCCTKPGMH